jgi:RNA polymerase sigma-70 factor, ECF subfamily
VGKNGSALRNVTCNLRVHGPSSYDARGMTRISQPPADRPITYCLVPYELSDELHEFLREHFRGNPSVEVIVERRNADRRERGDRRKRSAPRVDNERRTIAGETGRRVAERRAPVVEVELPALPPKLAAHRDQLKMVERLEPSSKAVEDSDSARLVLQIQAGDPDAYATIYMRYFDRIYSYLRMALHDAHEAEDATQQVFLRAMESLPTYEPVRPFRAWLFTIARNTAIDELRRRGRLQAEDPEQLEQRREHKGRTAETEDWALSWVSDRDLLHLVDRLPLIQRQVLFFRYALDLPASEVATILDMTPANVRQLHSRGLRFLRDRLAALGRSPKRGEEAKELRRLRRGVRHDNAMA